MGISTEWFYGSSDHKKAKELLIASTPCLELIDKVLERKIKDCLTVNSSDYETASWAYKQAHLNGKTEALKELQRIVRSAIKADP